MAGLLRLVFVFLLAGCATSGPRVGVIQVQTVMEESPWALAQMESLRKEINARQATLEEKCVEPLKKLEARLQPLADRPDADPEKSAAVLEKRQVYDGCVVLRSQMQDEISRVRDRFVADLMGRINTAAREVARRRKLDLVLLNQQPGPVAFSGPRVDVTSEVKKLMDPEP